MIIFLGVLIALAAPSTSAAHASNPRLECLRKFVSSTQVAYGITLKVDDPRETKRRVLLLASRYRASVQRRQPGVSTKGNAFADAHVYISTVQAAAFVEDAVKLGKVEDRSFHQNYFPSDYSCVIGLLSYAEEEKEKNTNVLSKMPAGADFLNGLISGLRNQREILEHSSAAAEVTVWISAPQGPIQRAPLSTLPRNYFDQPYRVPEFAWNYYLRLSVTDVKTALKKTEAMFAKPGVVRLEFKTGVPSPAFPYAYSQVTYRMSAKTGAEIFPESKALGLATASDAGGGLPQYLIDEINWRIETLEQAKMSGPSSFSGFSLQEEKIPTMIEELKKLRSQYNSAYEKAQFTIVFYQGKSS